MTILSRCYRHLRKDDQPYGVVVGNFDGLHLGHQTLLRRCVERCKQANLTPLLMTFEPHPRSFFQRMAGVESEPFRLTSLRDKLNLLPDLGINNILAQRFDHHLANMQAEEFVEDVLLSAIGARSITVGYDFQFGHQRRGNAKMLEQIASKHGVDVDVIEVQRDEMGIEHASTHIRELLRAGKMDEAALLLSRPFQMSGHVSPGRKLARQLGYPTANIHTLRYLIPRHGVYAGHALLGEEVLPAIANIGVKPTIDADLMPLLEVHLLEGGRDIYQQRLTFRFEHFLRAEKRFNGIDELSVQMGADVEKAKHLLDAGENSCNPSQTS